MNIAEAEQKTNTDLWLKKPLIISGPCSAETEAQVLQSALELAATQRVDILRAGIWKPRTRPGSFEGVGEIGLEWLKQAKAITGLPVMIEIATSKQVELALHAGIDILWVGARTTVNPFSVQDVADALKGVDIPVFIKNPLNADINLWTGAVERVAQAGIKKIGLIHRGFASYGNTEYRNAPMWHLAIEMKRLHTGLPFINDPSHICGRRDTLLKVAQKAIDLDYDGLMIESHPNPDAAWSDAEQQITASGLSELLQSIIWRNDGSASQDYHLVFESFRKQIDGLDDEIIQLLGQRMKIADKLAAFKKANDITILQTARWNYILARMKLEGGKLGLSPEFIQQFLDAVHMESIARQTRIFE